MKYTLAPGFDWNPLKRHRNLPCPCESGLKAKRCHGKFEVLPHEEVAKVKAYLRKLSALGFIEARPSEIIDHGRRDTRSQ